MSDEPKPDRAVPWVVVPDTVSPNDARFADRLVDASGNRMVGPTNDESLAFASPYAREQVRLAPSMDGLLRELEWSGDRDESTAFCPCCQQASFYRTGTHGEDCALAALLAKLDAARKATP